MWHLEDAIGCPNIVSCIMGNVVCSFKVGPFGLRNTQKKMNFGKYMILQGIKNHRIGLCSIVIIHLLSAPQLYGSAMLNDCSAPLIQISDRVSYLSFLDLSRQCQKNNCCCANKKKAQ